MLKVKFFGHCAKRIAAEHWFSYVLIWEFTMMLYASDIVSFYVAYQNNIKALDSYVAYKNNFKASYSDMLPNKLMDGWMFELFIDAQP